METVTYIVVPKDVSEIVFCVSCRRVLGLVTGKPMNERAIIGNVRSHMNFMGACEVVSINKNDGRSVTIR